MFNSKFISLGADISRSLNSTHFGKCFLSKKLNNHYFSLFFFGATVFDVSGETKLLKESKALGLDKISVKILELRHGAILHPLASFIINYRLISSLPCLNKIVERMVLLRFLSFFERNQRLVSKTVWIWSKVHHNNYTCRNNKKTQASLRSLIQSHVD